MSFNLRLSFSSKSFLEKVSIFIELKRKFYEIIERLGKHDEKFNKIVESLGEHNRKFNEIAGEIKMFNDKLDFFEKRLEVTIGSMGKRWSHDLEVTLLGNFKEVLEKEGIKT